MRHAVKEMFYTLQGEGANSDRPTVFLRFAGCNLWSARETDRADAVCRFCDTEFVGTNGTGGGKFETAEALAAVEAMRPAPDTARPAKHYLERVSSAKDQGQIAPRGRLEKAAVAVGDDHRADVSAIGQVVDAQRLR